MEASITLKAGQIARTQKRSTKDLAKAVLENVNPKAPREERAHREDPKKVNKSFIQGGPKKKVNERAGSTWRLLVGGPYCSLETPPKEAPKTFGGPLQRRPTKNVRDSIGVSKVPLMSRESGSVQRYTFQSRSPSV